MAEGVSRRGLLGAAGAGAAGIAAGAALERGPGGAGTSSGSGASTTTSRVRLARADAVVPGRGRLQPGIAGPVPACGYVMAVDLSSHARRSAGSARTATTALLRSVTGLAREAEQGRLSAPAGSAAGGIRAASLEITVGLGASLLAACGLSGARPPALIDLPSFATDHLDPGRSDGDLLVQVCAEDPMKVAGAVEAVSATLGAAARVRWAQQGFRQTTAASADPGQTARNLMGNKDGTNNPAPGSPLWDATVVTRQPDPRYAWVDQGSFLVLRRIRIALSSWFAQDVAARDRVIGRRASDGGPLSGGGERRPVDLEARDPHGDLAVPPHAHIRLASARDTAGARIYRRGFNYDNGWREGRRDAGLMFLAWQADPRRGFEPIQRSLTQGEDALNEFTRHVGSGVFAVPPSPPAGEYLAQSLMEG